MHAILTCSNATQKHPITEWPNIITHVTRIEQRIQCRFNWYGSINVPYRSSLPWNPFVLWWKVQRLSVGRSFASSTSPWSCSPDPGCLTVRSISWRRINSVASNHSNEVSITPIGQSFAEDSPRVLTANLSRLYWIFFVFFNGKINKYILKKSLTPMYEIYWTLLEIYKWNN